MSRWPALLPNSLAFLSSCWVMVIELVASRLVARYIGSSVYTWTAVIGVILAGISLGNHLGGRIADRHEPRRAVGFLFCGAALLVLLALAVHPLLGNSLSDLTGLPWGLRIVLVVATIFFLPAVALGTIGPVAAKMALEVSPEAGRAIGNVYAWGAIGSIVGTFMTGFWLIGLMGTVGILATSAGMLGLIGLLLLGAGRMKQGRVPTGIIALGLVAAATIASWPLPGRAEALHTRALERERAIEGLPVSYVADSTYYHILVRHDAAKSGLPRLTLLLDNLVHGFWVPREPATLEYEYENIYAALTHRFDRANGGDPLRAFFIGGGAYTFPRWLETTYPTSTSVVSEIDPAVLEVNHVSLGLARDTAIITRVGDARQVIETDPAASYDIIYGDAFHDLSVPFHLTTQEFITTLHTLLDERGLYLMNLVDFYDPDSATVAPFMGAMANTCRSVFGPKNVAVYVCTGEITPKPGQTVRTTYVIACGKAFNAFDQLMTDPAVADWLGPETPARPLRLSNETLAPLFAASPLLTDDFAPVEQLLAPVAAKRG